MGGVGCVRRHGAFVGTGTRGERSRTEGERFAQSTLWRIGREILGDRLGQRRSMAPKTRFAAGGRAYLVHGQRHADTILLNQDHGAAGLPAAVVLMNLTLGRRLELRWRRRFNCVGWVGNKGRRRRSNGEKREADTSR